MEVLPVLVDQHGPQEKTGKRRRERYELQACVDPKDYASSAMLPVCLYDVKLREQHGTEASNGSVRSRFRRLHKAGANARQFRLVIFFY